MYTYFSITIVLLILYIFDSDSNNRFYIKQIPLYVCFACIVEEILMIFTVNNPDYNVYKKEFELRRWTSIAEPGIRYISAFLEKIGLNYYWFFQILIIILILYTFVKWKRYSNNICIVLFLYSQFIMYYDIIQIRNAIASFLILLSLFYGIEGKTLKCILSVVAALYFHRLAFLTGAISIYTCIFERKKNNSPQAIDIINPILLAIVIGAFGKKIISISVSVPILSRLSSYTISNLSIDSLIIWAGYGICLLIAVWVLGIKQACIAAECRGDVQKIVAINILFKFSTFAVILSGFLLFMNEFNRIYRLFYLVLYIIIGMIYYDIEKKNRFILVSIVSLLNIIFMMVAMSRGLNFDKFW